METYIGEAEKGKDERRASLLSAAHAHECKGNTRETLL